MKKKKVQNITIGLVAVLIVAVIMAYNYSADQTRQKGLQFGIELEAIQEDVRQIQDGFYSEKVKWEEGDITREQLLEFYDTHVEEFLSVISEYDSLDPPELFSSSVELLKLSSETQLESDRQFIEWIKTGDESAKIRSDTWLQESLEYELHGLVEFYSAKTGVKSYDEPEKFEAPQRGLSQMVTDVYEHMKGECDATFMDESGEFASDADESGWSGCITDAEKWKSDHLQ